MFLRNTKLLIAFNNYGMIFLDVSVKDWRRKLLQMAAESIKANYESNKDGNDESNDKIDAEVKLLMQRQDWLDGMKKVSKNTMTFDVY